MGLINVDEKALCSAIYGARDRALGEVDENKAKIEKLECELNLLRTKIGQLERKISEKTETKTIDKAGM